MIEPVKRPWSDQAMRWAQLTLVDDDTRAGSGYSTEFWLDYFRDIKADATCLSAGGYMAFYPTEVEDHYRATNLGDADPFGDLVRGSRELGMIVMARIDPHAVHDSIFKKHPEWVAVDFDGNPIPHWSAPDLWITCPFGSYSTEFISKVNAEIMTRYEVDAIFANRWAGTGRCYCSFCKDAFRAATGHEIPRELDPASTETVLPPVEKAFRTWRQDALLAIARQWDAEIQAINPDARFVPNSGGGSLSDLDMSKLAAQSDTLFADKQARSGLSPAWINGRYAKEYRAVMDGKAVGGIFSVGVEEPLRWKDSVQSAEEIRIWVASGTANGMRAWFTKFGGTIPDSRWLDVVRDIYLWQAENEKYLRNTESIADVALVYSQQSAQMFGPLEAEKSTLSPLVGYYQALVESRTLFDMAHDQLLSAEYLEGKRVVILPNTTSLSDAQAEIIRTFVAEGGSVVATHLASLYDENGNERPDFALSDLFGAHYGGAVRRFAMNSYLEIQSAEDDPEHPLLAGIADTTRIINSIDFVETVADEGSQGASKSPLTLIDTYPDLPMEEVYRRDWSVGPQQVFMRTFGKGRVVYFPGNIDRTFHEFYTRDHYALLVNAVRWARNAPALVEATGPGIYEMVAWHQQDSMTVHLVNFNNPMYQKGPFHEFLPSPSLSVRVAIPEGRTVSGVRLLRAATDARSRVEGGSVVIEVPSVDDFEVLAIDLQ